MLAFLLVAVGSVGGGLARHHLALAVERRSGTTFPFGILLVNLTGCFLMGFLLALATRHPWLETYGHLIFVGFLGSYTTVSTFSLQTVTLWREGKRMATLAYALASVTGCMVGVCLGWLAGGGKG
jgi:CrcB protein